MLCLRSRSVAPSPAPDISMALSAHTFATRSQSHISQIRTQADAKEAIFNMDGAELFGRTLRVGMSRGKNALKGKAVWEALPEDAREADAAAAAAQSASGEAQIRES